MIIGQFFIALESTTQNTTETMMLNNVNVTGLDYYNSTSFVNDTQDEDNDTVLGSLGVTDIDLVNVSVVECVVEVLYSNIATISNLNMMDTSTGCFIIANGSKFGSIASITTENTMFADHFIYIGEISTVYELTDVSLTDANISMDFLTAVSSTIQTISNIHANHVMIGQDFISLNPNQTLSNMKLLVNFTNSTNGTLSNTAEAVANSTEITTIDLENVTIGGCFLDLNAISVSIISSINLFYGSSDCFVHSYGAAVGIFNSIDIETAAFSKYFIFSEYSTWTSVGDVSMTDSNISLNFVRAVSTNLEIISDILIMHVNIGQSFIALESANQVSNDTTILNTTMPTTTTAMDDLILD